MTIAQLDIDGFRFDKATQVTVDASGNFSHAMRECALRYNKTNFFLPGEITGGNTFGAIYLGRGREPQQYPASDEIAVKFNNNTSDEYFIRDPGYNALDAAAFHYSVYRTLTRFLGMDGNLEAGYDVPPNWVDMWTEMITSNDFVNANTGEFDPRHMYGVTNQDVFRWPAIANGTDKWLLGSFITTIHMPGSPLLLWGEEQAFYILDNTASNYIFGRLPMAASTAWKTHGCYSLNSTQFYNWATLIDAAANGCNDDSVTYDHRDPSHPIRNIVKSMYQMRENYPVLNDGFYLGKLSNMTRDIYLPGSNNTPTETGLWSVVRGQYTSQDLSNSGPMGNQSIWLIYSNENHTRNFEFDCSSSTNGLIAPFTEGTTVKNLFYPYDTQTLKSSPKALADGSGQSGCLESLEMKMYDFRAYVPEEKFIGPGPMLTNFTPGHDARLLSRVASGQTETLDLELQFSQEMDCVSVQKAITFNSTTENGKAPTVKDNQFNCGNMTTPITPPYIGGIASTWSINFTLEGVSNGVHQLAIDSPLSASGVSTNSTDKLLFRIGQADNPMVWQLTANYTSDLLHAKGDQFYISHKAPGADSWRYSLNWGTTWSNYSQYKGGNVTIDKQPWSGTSTQAWKGDHLIVQYWNRMTGSADTVQHADLNWGKKPPRRWPHLFWQGPYNQYGYDGGLKNQFELKDDGRWHYDFMYEWPAIAQVNVWGMNPDGKPDQSFVFGDIDGDSVLDRLPPSSLTSTVVNITEDPPQPYLAWSIILDDGNYRFQLIPKGNRYHQMALFCLLWIIPPLTGALACYGFMKSFYSVKFNQIGVSEKTGIIPLAIRRKLKRGVHVEKGESMNPLMKLANKSGFLQSTTALANNASHRRMVLIATMEYDIEDWAIKIKIGGLGVMAQLMGKNLGHQDLIWVVPCVGGVDYPVDQEAEPMSVTILGNPYEVRVQYHVLRNITYVLLDAPVFRQQSKSEPYPPRMDDLDSAIYYSAWNQCVALAIKRFPIDLYHINDYHGSIAPLYLLPETVPACLSLHNAEFQGLWPMRTVKEREEVCQVFNLDPEVAARYVQFGEVFNLLHAGASYLRVHQQGFGAVGVSKKYGKRSFARYPIFWGLKKVGNLPNPDPSDTGEWNKELPKDEDIRVDPDFEAKRAELKRQAQEWAGLIQDPKADLLVFVGRWSMQKGVDLIADVFPKVLDERPNVQLVAIGPVIDLYGKFAALKLGRMMELYPGRVFSKPEFTALPPYIFSGAEFALIPSRDEPFGLVAVEFGRKGALGIGARVGGLGQMPGWWYTVESTTTSHLLHQFKQAIDGALNSKLETRAMMRARSAKQRFPVAQWVEDLEILQSTAIRIHDKEAAKSGGHHPTTPGLQTPTGMHQSMAGSRESGLSTPVMAHSRNASFGNLNRISTIRPASNIYSNTDSPPRDSHSPSGNTAGLSRQLSLGVRAGPGHLAAPTGGRRGRKLSKKRDTSASGFDEKHPDPNQAVGVAVTDVEEESDDDVIPSYYGDDEYTMTAQEAEASRRMHAPPLPALNQDFLTPGSRSSSFHNQDTAYHRAPGTPPSEPPTPGAGDGLLPPSRPFSVQNNNRLSNASMLSLNSVVGDKKDFNLQKVDPFFTDSTGEYYRAFEQRLQNLDASNSESQLCIEDYLVKSEKKWFEKFRDARLGRGERSPAPSMFRKSKHMSRAPSPAGSIFNEDLSTNGSDGKEGSLGDQFLLGENYVPPSGLKKYMQYRLGDWPVYSFLLGFGQIIAANSYQITLLTGTVGETATKLYVTAGIYGVASICWWFAMRSFKSIYSLAIPFIFYGGAFFLIGMAHFASAGGNRSWVQNVATALYAIASSSGSIFFALNFGDEGGAPVKDWVYRASIIQGTQQAYVVALWYWGDKLSKADALGNPTGSVVADSIVMTVICVPVACLMWGVGILIYLGLPDFYRQTPGKVPSFYKSIHRRKVVMWFFVAVVLQNFWLSAPYGRNWAFLWGSEHAKAWQIVILVIVFFFVVWAIFLYIFAILSKDHSWILPVFAIGLGAPRWCQMLWGISGIGWYVPWANGRVASALVSRSIWLWLGTLDALQGVGFGMILLQTLTRLHIAFTLVCAQVLGSIATICARAFAPDKIGPGQVFPDFSAGFYPGLTYAWFWICLLCQIAIGMQPCTPPISVRTNMS